MTTYIGKSTRFEPGCCPRQSRANARDIVHEFNLTHELGTQVWYRDPSYPPGMLHEGFTMEPAVALMGTTPAVRVNGQPLPIPLSFLMNVGGHVTPDDDE